MNSSFLFLIFGTIVAGLVGFGTEAGVVSSFMQVAFFILAVASVMSLVYSRGRPT